MHTHDNTPALQPLIDPLFATHPLTTEGVAAAMKVAEDFTTLLRQLEPCAASPREFAIVKTQLQQAKQMAVMAIALQPRFQAGR